MPHSSYERTYRRLLSQIDAINISQEPTAFRVGYTPMVTLEKESIDAGEMPSDDVKSAPVTNHFPYTLVETKETFNNFLDNLHRYLDYNVAAGEPSYLYIDSEGQDLGCIGGKLGLLQIGFNARLNARKARQMRPRTRELKVYLLDVVKVSEKHLKRFWHKLNCSAITKIVWDGKMDTCELFQGWQIYLDPALDLQVVEVSERIRRSERQDPWSVHRLGDLRKIALPLLTMEQQDSVSQIDGIVKAQHRNNESKLWLHRPLSQVMLQYASMDIYCIAAVHESFQAKCLWSDIVEREYIAKSRLYCQENMFERRDPSDKFTHHGFLPMGILQTPPSLDDEDAIECCGCHRLISLENFHPSTRGWKRVNRLCPVCYIISNKRVKR